MRKSFSCALFLFLVSAALSSATQFIESSFVPLDPQVMGQGGSLVANAHGYESMFFNPAGYSRGKPEFTTFSSLWVHARPDQFLNLIVGPKGQSDILTFLNNQVTKGGFGMGSSLGFGYTANGLCLGFVMMADSMMFGPTLLGLSGDVTGTVAFIGGYSVPIQVGGFTVHVGGDVRPMIRAHTILSNADAIQVMTALSTGGNVFDAMNNANAVYGVGLGLDLGAIAELWWFTVGLSIRDLGGTIFTYKQNTFGALSSSLSSQVAFPAGTPVSDQYVIPMDVALGFGFHPDLGTVGYYFDPSLSLDMHDLIGTFSGSKSFWTLLHMGMEFRLISLFNLQLGLDTGYLTFGAGMKMAAFDMNFAVFTQELGAHIGDRPGAGASIGFALHF